MSCCGTTRRAWQARPAQPLSAPSISPDVVYFRYADNKGMTVIGSFTGRTYQFWGPGATVATDPRDAAGMTGIPQLVRVVNP